MKYVRKMGSVRILLTTVCTLMSICESWSFSETLICDMMHSFQIILSFPTSVSVFI